MCCASSRRTYDATLHIDARNDESTGKYKDVGTIEDYKPNKFERTLESLYDGHKKKTYGW